MNFLNVLLKFVQLWATNPIGDVDVDRVEGWM